MLAVDSRQRSPKTVVTMAKLASAEMWGGPFDGVTVDCSPVPTLVTVFYDPATKRMDWTAKMLAEDDPKVITGYYWPSSPGRLTWRRL